MEFASPSTSRRSAPQPGPREEKRPDWEAWRPFGNLTPQAETIPSDLDEDQEIKLHVLPPARYHYTEETRLSAIGILVRLKDGQTYQTIEEGIRRMGRLDLHSALQALESLDHATDEIVYQAVADYLKINLAEYRIFCAFLLRQRYGVKPAELLVELLLDGDTRVHQYTARLFERRRVESALIGQVIHKINTHPELRPWHLDNLVRLLGKKAQFKPGEPIKQFESAIIVALTHLLSYPRAHIRLEAYRAILQYPNLINLQSIKSSMLQDPDIYIRTMAHKITAPTSMPGV